MLQANYPIEHAHLKSIVRKILLFSLIFFCLLPSSFVRNIVGIDHFSASQHLFEYALKHGFLFGVNFIDNVGPLGYLHYPFYYAGNAYWTKILWFSVDCAFYAYYAMTLIQGLNTLTRKALFLFTVCFFPLCIDNPWFCFEVLPRLAALFSALYFLNANRQDCLKNRFLILINGLFYAMLLLEKASNVYYLLVLISSLTCYWLLKRRYFNVILLLATFLVTTFMLWVLAGQTIENLPQYFISMNLFIDAYQNLFSQKVLSKYLISGIACCLILVLVLITRTRLAFTRHDPWPELFQALIISTLLFLSWKHGILRNTDSFGTFLYIIPALVAYVCLYPIQGVIKKHESVLFSTSFYVFFLLAFWVAMLYYEHKLNLHRTIYGEFSRRFSMLVQHHPREIYNQLHQRYVVSTQDFLLPKPLAHRIANHTVDEFGNSPEIIFMNQLNYQPRPIPITYIVTNRGLIEKNGLYYLNPKTAPDYIFIEEYGLRFSDSLAYLSVLLNYHYIDQFKNWKVLEKNSAWKVIQVHPAIKHTVATNDWYYLNDWQSFFTWVSIDIKPRLLGRLKQFFYTPTKIQLEIQYTNHKTQQLLVSPAQLRAGFLMSPIISKDSYYKNVENTNLNVNWKLVKAFRIVRDRFRTSLLWQPDFNVSLAKIHVTTAGKPSFGLTLSQAKSQIAAVKGVVDIKSAQITVAALCGNWDYQGAPVSITCEGKKLLLQNELGHTSPGFVEPNGTYLIAPAWGNAIAILSEDQQRLHWFNGIIWLRQRQS